MTPVFGRRKLIDVMVAVNTRVFLSDTGMETVQSNELMLRLHPLVAKDGRYVKIGESFEVCKHEP